MEMTQEVWDRIAALEAKVESLQKSNVIADTGRGMRSFFGGLKSKLATYGIHLDGVEGLAPANEEPGSGSERWGASDWTAADGEGLRYPGDPKIKVIPPPAGEFVNGQGVTEKANQQQ